jgi:hypothetical protein
MQPTEVIGHWDCMAVTAVDETTAGCLVQVRDQLQSVEVIDTQIKTNGSSPLTETGPQHNE